MYHNLERCISDNLDRLTGVDNEPEADYYAQLYWEDDTFDYDDVGNRKYPLLSDPFPYGNTNRLQVDGYLNRYEYDQNGNVTRKTATNVGYNVNDYYYHYDAENRLTGIDHVDDIKTLRPLLSEQTGVTPSGNRRRMPCSMYLHPD